MKIVTFAVTYTKNRILRLEVEFEPENISFECLNAR